MRTARTAAAACAAGKTASGRAKPASRCEIQKTTAETKAAAPRTAETAGSHRSLRKEVSKALRCIGCFARASRIQETSSTKSAISPRPYDSGVTDDRLMAETRRKPHTSISAVMAPERSAQRRKTAAFSSGSPLNA